MGTGGRRNQIDEAGTVYEGRYSGDDGIPAFDPDGNLVTAFHTSGYNSGHRDWLQADCPGRTMYDLLDDVRARAGGK
ncbi:hypothetical protein ABZX77_03640 [Streptomyces sp. NPDC004237]|uniref:hypothetical protein n=1 Tax=Streptomyces sp. NPDC004237 TaxID=3154455 RepID=UPI0033B28EB8